MQAVHILKRICLYLSNMKQEVKSPIEKESKENAKSKLRGDVKIYSDLTPTEKNVLKELGQELTRRKENDENDLIKYIRSS